MSIDQEYLGQALSLGLRDEQAADASRILFRETVCSYLVAALQSQTAETPAPTEALPSTIRPPAPRSPSINGSAPSLGHANNGRLPGNSNGAEEVRDPLSEAEALRTALSEVGRQMGRLIVSLRHLQKQRPVLQRAWTSLQLLGLGNKEAP